MRDYFLTKATAGNFDLLRGLAVSLVLLSHADAYEMILPQNKLTLFFKTSFGHVGVMLFFILSGCLIWHSASRCLLNYKTPWLQYFYQRTARVLSLYLVSILVVVVLASSFKGGHVPDISFSNILRHITFTQDINPSVARNINPVLWSLTHEVIFYCLVPVLMVASRNKQNFVLILASSIGLCVLGFLFPNAMFSNFYKYSTLFAVGIAIAHYGYQLKLATSLLLLILAILVTLITPKLYDFGGYLVIAICLFNLISQNEFFKTKLFSPFAYLGVISYSVYIWHYLVIELFYPISLEHRFLDDLPIRSLCSLFLILGLSIITYFLIERPFMRLAKHRSNRHILVLSQSKHA